jgi:hypothetical protein
LGVGDPRRLRGVQAPHLRGSCHGSYDLPGHRLLPGRRLAGRPTPTLRQRGPSPPWPTARSSRSSASGSSWASTPTPACTSTSAATGAPGSQACGGCTARPLPARRPTCGRSSTASTSTCSPRSRSTHRPAWSTAWPSRSAGSLGPTAAGGCGSSPAWGHDEVAKQTYLGLRAHLRVCWPGVIVDGRLAPANLHDLAVAEELLAGVSAWTLADRNYGSPRLAAQLAAQGGWLLAPPRGARRSQQRPPPWLAGKRRRVETVIGQLTGRYHLKQVWARDAWHPVVTLAAQAAQPHHRRLPVPALRAAAPALRPARHHLKPHTGLAIDRQRWQPGADLEMEPAPPSACDAPC